jgi:hypothetical protein
MNFDDDFDYDQYREGLKKNLGMSKGDTWSLLIFQGKADGWYFSLPILMSDTAAMRGHAMRFNTVEEMSEGTSALLGETVADTSIIAQFNAKKKKIYFVHLTIEPDNDDSEYHKWVGKRGVMSYDEAPSLIPPDRDAASDDIKRLMDGKPLPGAMTIEELEEHAKTVVLGETKTNEGGIN